MVDSKNGIWYLSIAVKSGKVAGGRGFSLWTDGGTVVLRRQDELRNRGLIHAFCVISRVPCGVLLILVYYIVEIDGSAQPRLSSVPGAPLAGYQSLLISSSICVCSCR